MAKIKYPCPIGEKFGKWTVLGEAPRKELRRGRFFTCKCECGTVQDNERGNLVRVEIGGCKRCQEVTGPKPMIGKVFNKWTVLEEVKKENQKCKHYKCKCLCGSISVSSGDHLRMGRSKQCISCAAKKHGFHKHYLYQTWSHMKQRCEQSQNPAYKHYGGRGITVCDRWQEIKNFIEDMGERPSRNYSLDRIDNDKGYYKENCRWATHAEQMSNTRSNRFITYLNETKTLTEWARYFGVHQGNLAVYLKTHTIQEVHERYKK